MAVPMDIEAGIEDEENSLCHLDELTSLSEKNQHLRFEAADRAREMLERILMISGVGLCFNRTDR